MKKIIYVASLMLALSQQSHAITLSTGGALTHCRNEGDIAAGRTGYSLYEPSILISDNSLYVSISYMVTRCQSKDGEIGFFPTALLNSQDKILFEVPRFFDMDDFVGGSLDMSGVGNTFGKIPLSQILSSSELASFEKGESFNKYIVVRYGNYLPGNDPLLGDSYGRAGGFYYLEFSMQNNVARVLSFTATEN